MAPPPVQCYGLCSISISGVLKVMDNVEGNYREGIHAWEKEIGGGVQGVVVRSGSVRVGISGKKL